MSTKDSARPSCGVNMKHGKLQPAILTGARFTSHMRGDAHGDSYARVEHGMSYPTRLDRDVDMVVDATYKLEKMRNVLHSTYEPRRLLTDMLHTRNFQLVWCKPRKSIV